jgi:hypothetical protein
MIKHRGGRGRRAKNKHETVTISLPPHLKALLDGWVTDEVSRSEVVAVLIEAHAVKLEAGEAVRVNTLRQRSEAPSRPSQGQAASPKRDYNKGKIGRRGNSERLALSAAVLHVMQRTMPRGQKWTPAKYELAEKLLSEGDTLTANGVDYLTERGNVMSWRTAEALVRLGVLVVPPTS